MEEIKKLRAKCQISNTLNSYNRLYINAIHNLPINSPILVQREGNIGKSDYQSEFYTLIVIKGESCIINLSYNLITFRSIFIKPYYIGDIKEATNNRKEEKLEEEA